MGLIGVRTSSYMLTTEMEPKHLAEFENGWVQYEVFLLMCDGISRPIAELTARDQFELMRKDGFTKVNETRLRKRKLRRHRLGLED